MHSCNRYADIRFQEADGEVDQHTPFELDQSSLHGLSHANVQQVCPNQTPQMLLD